MQTHRRWIIGTVLIAALGVSVVAARADDAKPTTAPAADGPRRGPGIGRLVENLAKLDLTPDQKQKTAALIDEVKAKLQALRDDADAADRPAKARDILGGVRDKLRDILTPEQQEKLRDLMQQSAEPPRPPADAAVDRPKSPDAPPTMKPDADAPKMAPDRPERENRKVVAPSKPAATPAPEVGQAAPDFSLKATDDKPVTLASFKGKVLVLVFGSYSAPSFRERVPGLEKIARDYGTRATFLVIYTREAYAVGEWEVDRNKDENISVEQPKSAGERLTVAKLAVSNLKLTMPVLVDGMDDAIGNAYGLSPNGAVVINRDGTVAARQHWFEPISLHDQLDAALAVPRPAKN